MVLGSSLAVFGGWGIVVFGLVVGLAVYIHRANSLSMPSFVALAAYCLVCLLVVRLISFGNDRRESSRRAQCINTLAEIAGALHSYHQANGGFPPAYIADKTGKPMHSWRAILLPFLDYNAIYTQFDFSQPWDGPTNKNHLSLAPILAFLCPNDYEPNTNGSARTSYFAVVAPCAAWQGEKPRKFADFGDKAAETIMVVESLKSGILWAEPRDISLDSHGAANPDLATLLAPAHPGGRDAHFLFIYYYAPGVHVITADGKVRMLNTEGLTREDLGKILQIGGCAEDTLGRRVLFDDYERRVNWPNIAALAVWLLSVGALLVGAVWGRKPRSVSPVPPPAN